MNEKQKCCGKTSQKDPKVDILKRWMVEYDLFAVIICVGICFGILVFILAIFFVAFNTIPLYNILDSYVVPEESVPIGDFGNYVGGIMSVFAFLGVLYSIQFTNKRFNKQEVESRDRYREDSERVIFFQLLDLHTNKMQTEYRIENVIEPAPFLNNNKEVEPDAVNLIGINAFKKILVYANELSDNWAMYNYIRKIESLEDLYIGRTDKEKIDSFLRRFFSSTDLDTMKSESERSLRYLLTDRRDFLKSGDENPIYTAMYNCCYDYSDFAAGFRFVGDILIRDFGYILSPYYSNIYNILRTVDGWPFADDCYKKRYIDILRNQLSSTEIAMIVYASMSKQAPKEFSELMLRYGLLSNLNLDDLNCSRSIIRTESDPYDRNAFISEILELKNEN
jgi:hypothetical protein